MRTIAIPMLGLYFALGFSSPSLAASPTVKSATGSFHEGGSDYVIVDALAFKGEHGIQILFSEKALDVPQLLSDLQLDVNDQFNLGAVSMQITVYKADGSSYSLNLMDAKYSDGDCDDGDYLKITRLDDASIAGSFICEKHNVLFDLPLLKDRPGTKLPAGGGEPGKAQLARAAAMQANNLDAFIQHSSPNQVASAKAAAAVSADELASKFRALGRFSPPNVEIVGGTQVDDRAWLDFANADRSLVGTILTLRQDGRWLVDGVWVRQ